MKLSAWLSQKNYLYSGKEKNYSLKYEERDPEYNWMHIK